MHGKPFSHKEFFVKKWADYVNTHDDWSVIHARFINAQILNAAAMYQLQKGAETKNVPRSAHHSRKF